MCHINGCKPLSVNQLNNEQDGRNPSEIGGNAEPKQSYNIITGNSSKLRTVFNQPRVFSAVSACHYEMALFKLET